jgi:hypothetical protein
MTKQQLENRPDLASTMQCYRCAAKIGDAEYEAVTGPMVRHHVCPPTGGDPAEKAFLREWLVAHGTENQVERFDAGVLPTEEYLTDMANLAFQPLADWHPFLKISSEEVLGAVIDAHRFAGATVQFRSTAAAQLTGEQWTRLKEMRKALPDATIEPRQHEGTLDDRRVPNDVVKRYGALATIHVGPVELRREYAL